MVAKAYHINSNLYHYAGNNPVKYTDPTGRWFGFDDAITGPIDEIAVLGVLTIIGAISIYNSDENKNFEDALNESFTYNLDRIKNFFAKDEINWGVFVIQTNRTSRSECAQIKI